MHPAASDGQEPSSKVRAVLKNGATLAAELNALEGDGKPNEDEGQAAWATTKASIKQEVFAQLALLEEMQFAAEHEPDVLKKQALLVRARDASRALAVQSENVKDIGSALNVVIRFLNVIDKKLEVIDAKLDTLQSSVAAMHSDLKRLIGKPVLEVVRERRTALLGRHRALRDKVYIPLQGVAAGPDGKFEINNDVNDEGKQINPAFDLMQEVERFLMSEDLQVLLLAGPAGSGKSTFVQEFELLVETTYKMARSKAGVEEVVLMRVSLPTLANPLTALFHEVCVQMGLREAQEKELVEKVNDGKVELVFLLDAYDELKPQIIWKVRS